MPAVVAQRPGRRRRAWRRLAGRAGHGSYFRTGIVMVLFLVAVGLGAYLQRRVVPEPPPGTSIAVLPFTHGGGADEAFGDGLAEEILGLVGTVSGVRTPVWSTSASLRGLSAPEAARRLGVDHVLDGSVREDEGRLRIRVSLSDAAGMSRWSERYDVLQGDVFRTQEDIARSVLQALEVELSGDAVVARQGGTEDFSALTYYQKGRHAWYKRTPDGFRQAVAYFGSAVKQDPRYARAYAGLADTYSLMGAYDYGLMPPDSAHELARAAASTALHLAPELAEAHAAMGQVRFAYGRDWAGADEAYRRAIDLNPRYAEAYQWYSLYLVAVGRPEEAMTAAKRALALDTVSPVMHSNMGRHLYYRQDYEAAREAFHRLLSIDQGFFYAHLGLGQVLLQLDPAEAVGRFTRALDLIGQPHLLTLALLGNALGRAGRPDDARDILQQIEAIRAAGVFVPPEYPAIVHAGLGQFDETVAAFEAAYHGGSTFVSVLAVEPLALPLRGHAGFERLLAMAAPPGALR
jgi:TolB-like protein/tetratricopeptide (TPR) repeat protein